MSIILENGVTLHRFSVRFTMNSKKAKYYLYTACIGVLIICGLFYYYFMSSFSTSKDTYVVYIDNDDNIDSVYHKLNRTASIHAMTGFTTLVRHSNYADHIKTGRYAIAPGEGAFKVFRRLKRGAQSPISLTIPEVRTMDRLAGVLSHKLMIDSIQLVKAFTDQQFCMKYGYDTATIACLFIPNTYDIYWNVSLDKLMERMQKENKTFWNFDRMQKATAIGMAPTEVVTLASIIDEETANNSEKPMIAGMYYNRLKLRNSEYPDGMPLQADPTIKFAWKRFDLHRIYNNLLYIKSPYNTYKNPGLPPGPIKIASIAGIDAVLNHTRHQYYYMCAKEDFSGTHNFARTYQEHLQNAAKYAKALNEHGIK